MIHDFRAGIGTRLTFDVIIVLSAFLLTVLANLCANTRIGLGISGVCRQ
jgi:hypothetical protein